MRSIYLLGKDTADEWRLVDQLGGAPNRFFRAAQKIAWGITQPDLTRADVVELARRLVRSHGTAFPAHLFAAWVWRGRDPARAERSLADARALATPDHPLGYVLPTDAEWSLAEVPQRLVEIHPGRMWRVAHLFALAGSPLHHDSVATIIRFGSGELAIVNPIAFAPAIAERIRALGDVRWVITQGKAHSAFVAPTCRQFPGARAIGTRGHLTHPAARHLALDGLLDTGELPDELAVLPIAGHLFEEVLLVDRPSRTLIVQDVFAMSGASHSFLARLYALAWGALEPVSYAAFSLVMWQSLPVLHASLAALRGEDLAHVVGAHGTVTPRAGDVARVHALIDYTRGVSGLAHKAMLARLFAAQPSSLRDLVAYLRASKHHGGAQLREAVSGSGA